MKKRELFLSEVTKSILLPYETSRIYEEEIVGEFENQFEKGHFNRFLAMLKEKHLILDLACGDGRHTLRLSKKVNRLVAFDLSANNLMMAKKKCRQEKNVAFIKGSMFELPLRENVFDGVWFSQAFEYVPPDKREGFMTLIRRVLKLGGILYMSVETWMDPKPQTALIELLGDFRLFCYWKFLKRKPLLWGEFLYYLSAEDIQARCSGWHYHVHTDRRTLHRLLQGWRFKIRKSDVHGGYIYTLCEKIEHRRGCGNHKTHSTFIPFKTQL